MIGAIGQSYLCNNIGLHIDMERKASLNLLATLYHYDTTIETNLTIPYSSPSTFSIDNPSMDDKIKDLAIVLLESVETTRLDARARLFLKWGHLVQTIHATVAIMELAPSSVSHYLHTGMLDPFKDITHQ